MKRSVAMSQAVELERDAVLQALLGVVEDPGWRSRLHSALTEAGRAVHIAVMNEPYLQLLLSGKKTIESRFSLRRMSPFESAAVGDLIVVKQQSGPLVGIAEIEHVGFYELDPETWASIRERFDGPLCAMDDEFWELRAEARYATLLGVRQTLRISPLPLRKSDRRGWVRLGLCDACQQELAL